MLEHGNFDQLRVVWRVLNHSLPLSLTTSICPWLDSFYDKITSLDIVQPLVSVSIIPAESSTHIVFSWLREYDDDAMWIRNATAATADFENLLNLCIAETEDCCFRPSFWASLAPEVQERVVQNMRHSMFHVRDEGVRLIHLA
jgi:hypothetical protein